MKIRGLISSIFISVSISMGATQADNITTRDDLFHYLRIGNGSSNESVRTPECIKPEAREVDPASMGAAQTGNMTTRDDLFDG